MLGLFNKSIDQALLQKRYKDSREKLLALLEEDAKLIEKEFEQLKQAITALKKGKKVDQGNIGVLKDRLALVHSRILEADKLAGQETSHLPAETTTLSELQQAADEIFRLLGSKK
ncbi:hypothetical protein COY27_02145 [Candidatus Woesearchaeota archaeon CG_4_10_14_0_2_um_filter_33_13]|nr:MAG: hypothetical protein COY27_02145 [Candidatus Woesearchaeota archaeon CG_4_10_14_0_2_um_filter_33_13]